MKMQEHAHAVKGAAANVMCFRLRWAAAAVERSCKDQMAGACAAAGGGAKRACSLFFRLKMRPPAAAAPPAAHARLTRVPYTRFSAQASCRTTTCA